MTAPREARIAPGAGWATTMAAGETLSVTARSIVSLVCLSAANPRERFDQARTKVYNMKIWLAAGDALFSKLNNPMMTLVEDGFDGAARHDAQYPGCREALAAALAGHGIPEAETPQPLNLLHHVEIDTATGLMTPTPRRPAAPVTMVLRAEMDLIVAVAACPGPLAPGGAEPVWVTVSG
ncbi:MAG: DUF1989 domain-containing protein [Alphaproteobacteria bacterium]|nr:DUF1989 domain-containing protein [Alphaproteobacteria bacterium]